MFIMFVVCTFVKEFQKIFERPWVLAWTIGRFPHCRRRRQLSSRIVRIQCQI
ncbi:unnamed protein product [Nesidiocoris tenuis]|uniref:Uncharacterized protein n=1 Tax=Nesidiocoris tenuis TaxID=355587 RepID=A0A6H5FYD3_9HEMI|nr:unnamed protein product [Nesidiocoris tenuis]